MKNAIRAVASLTVSGLVELARSRVYIAVLVAGVVLVLSAAIFEELAAGEGGRMIANIGGAFVSLLVSVLGIITSITRLSREIETKRLYHVIFRPFPRGAVPIACFASSAILVILSSLVLGGLLGFLGWFGSWPHPERAFVIACVGSLEGIVVCAVATLFASVSSSAVASINATLFFILGRLAGELQTVAEREHLGAGLSAALRGVLTIVPRLDRFDASVWNDVGANLGPAVAYAGVYSVGALLIAIGLFSRREL